MNSTKRKSTHNSRPFDVRQLRPENLVLLYTSFKDEGKGLRAVAMGELLRRGYLKAVTKAGETFPRYVFDVEKMQKENPCDCAECVPTT
jgi:hypothetical protein